MIRKLIISLFGFTVFLGVISYIVNIVVGTPMLETIRIGNSDIIMYIFRWDKYLQNIQGTIQILNKIQILSIPNQPPMYDWVGHTFQTLANYIFYGLDWIIFVFNVLLVPWKFLFYLIMIVLSLFGIPTNMNSFTYLIKYMYEFQIPYINYLTW